MKKVNLLGFMLLLSMCLTCYAMEEQPESYKRPLSDSHTHAVIPEKKANPGYSHIKKLQPQGRRAPRARSTPGRRLPFFTRLETLHAFNTAANSWPEQRTLSPDTVNQELNRMQSDQITTKIDFKDMNALMSRCIDRFNAEIGDNPLDMQHSYVIKKEVPVESEIAIVGDIHGAVHSLLKILTNMENREILNNNFEITRDNFYMVFTGDYVDRGMYGTEVCYILMKLKLANWDKVFLLRGNHEDSSIFNMYGFCKWTQGVQRDGELHAKYGQNADALRDKFIELFERLPFALYLKSGGNCVQFCHGGTQHSYNPTEFLANNNLIDSVTFVAPESVSRNGFTWSDFSQQEGVVLSSLERAGLSVPGCANVEDFITEQGVRAIFRGHQHFYNGLKMLGGVFPEPTNWEEIVSPEVKASGEIRIANYLPVFTFTTATVAMSPQVFYGILRTAAQYEDWILKPILIEQF